MPIPQVGRDALNVAYFDFDGSIEVNVGDLMYHDSDDVKPASSQADQGSAGANQDLFAPLFAGVAGDSRKSGDTQALTDFLVWTDVIATYDCVSDTYEVGDYVTVTEVTAGTSLEDQKLEKTTDETRAIGRCVKRVGTAATRVKVRLISSVLPNSALGDPTPTVTDINVVDDGDAQFGDGNDALVRWSTADADNHTLVIALGDSNQALHLTDAAAVATDWNVAADTHPSLYIHSNTTPATDYLLIGAHDGTTAFINNVGGTTIELGGNLTVDQAAQDINALALRSSDVATVLTTAPLGPDVTTEDFFTIGKASATLGGAYVQSLAESTATEALHIDAWGGSPATTDTSSSLACINIFGGEHDGANADADMAADSNLLAVGEIDSSATRNTRLLLKADDGELHLGNATPAALDDYDDVSLVRSLQMDSSGGVGIRPSLYDPTNPLQNQEILRDLGIVGEKDKHGFSLFALQPRLALHEGAIWQVFNDLMAVVVSLPQTIKNALPERITKRLSA